jgi:hypothetical protein
LQTALKAANEEFDKRDDQDSYELLNQINYRFKKLLQSISPPPKAP